MRQFFLLISGNPFLRSSAVVFAGMMLVNILNYGFHLVVGRSLSVQDFGEVESLISLLVIISVPAATLNLVVTKYAASMRAEQNTGGIRGLAFVLSRKIILYGIFILFLAFFLTPFLKRFLNIEDALPIFFLWGVIFFTFLSSVTHGLLIGWQRFRDSNITGILEAFLKFCIAVLFIWLGFGVSGVVGTYVLSGFLGYAISWYFLKKLFEKRGATESEEKKLDFSPLKKYLLPAFYGTLAIAIFGNADMVFAKHHLDATLSGEYSSLFIAAKTIFFVSGVLGVVLFSMSAETNHLKGNTLPTFLLALFLTVLIGAGSVLFFYFFPEFVLGLFFGGKYLHVAPYLVWFGLAAALYSLTNLLLQYLLSLHETRAASFFLVLAGLEVAILFLWGEELYAIITITIVVQILAILLGLVFILKKRHG